MSLLSLLIALAADRSLSAKIWQFNFYYQHYHHFFSKNFTAKQGTTASAVFIILPVIATYLLLDVIDNSVLQLLLSTVILIVCFGCTTTRKSYKSYLHSAFRGEETRQRCITSNCCQIKTSRDGLWPSSHLVKLPLLHCYYVVFYRVWRCRCGIYRLLTLSLSIKKQNVWRVLLKMKHRQKQAQ